jgi:tetratricopeptide (TPR) repeat protein
MVEALHDPTSAAAFQAFPRHSPGPLARLAGPSYRERPVRRLELSASLYRETVAGGWEAAALFSLASLHCVRGDIDGAEERYRECLAIFRDPDEGTGEAHALRGLGFAYQQHGRCEAAVHCLDRCIPVFHEIGDRLWEGHALLTMAYAERGLGHLRASAAHARSARAILQRLGDRRGEAMALRALGAAAIELGRPERALAFLRRCLDLFRTLDDPIGAARAPRTTWVASGVGRAATKRPPRAFAPACRSFRDLGLRRWEDETSGQLGSGAGAAGSTNVTGQRRRRAALTHPFLEPPPGRRG